VLALEVFALTFFVVRYASDRKSGVMNLNK